MKKYFLLFAVAAALWLGVSEWLTQAVPEGSTVMGSSLVSQTVAATPLWTSSRSTESLSTGKGVHALGTTPLEIGKNILRQNKKEWKLQSFHDFRPVVFTNPLGTTIKYSVYQNDLPVLGMEITIDLGNDLSVSAVSPNYRPVQKANLDLSKMLSPDDALGRLTGSSFTPDAGGNVSKVLYVSPGSDIPELAYAISGVEQDGHIHPVQLIVRASDGQLLNKSFSRMENHR